MRPPAWRDLPLARRIPEIAEMKEAAREHQVTSSITSLIGASEPRAGLGRSELDAVADSSVADDLGQTKSGSIDSRQPALADPDVVSGRLGTQPLRSDANGFKGRGVWDQPATKRGRTLEKIYSVTICIQITRPSTFGTQIRGPRQASKSIDLEAPVYQVNGKYGNALYNKLSKAVDDLAEFSGGRYAGNDVQGHRITSRTLTVIVPGLGTPEQSQVLRQIFEVGRQRGVIVRMEVYR